LNAPNTPSNGNDDGISPRNEETPIELEENSNCSIDDGLQLSKSGKNYPCKICGSNIVDGEKLKILATLYAQMNTTMQGAWQISN